MIGIPKRSRILRSLTTLVLNSRTSSKLDLKRGKGELGDIGGTKELGIMTILAIKGISLIVSRSQDRLGKGLSQQT